ncbi:hypothetical protein [Carboxylicivirga sp. M1479]|uniref:hypothetical protein n=1 Tax=Carboxylicivirga sp. M1479 TaxID=2594476 RepID=UPI0011785149|nr:hypothetical protein [Carboxylicivirga sp. M1479]TRX72008.1 hypothetical protein FNN09_03105 [Carboxylicivirga sp. M1479]
MLKLLNQISFYVRFYYVEIIVFTLFAVDAYSFYLDSSQGLEERNRFSFFFRAAVELGGILMIFFNKTYKKKHLYHIIILIALPVMWLSISWMINDSYSINTYNAFQIIKESNKYIFPIILFWTFSLSSSKYQFKILEIIYILAALVVIYAFVTDNSLFYTYGPRRFGYKPMIAAHNEISLFWIIGIVYFLKKIKDDFNIWNLVIISILLFASILLGTKVILLFFTCLTLWLLIDVVKLSFFLKGVIFVLSLFLLILFVTYTGVYDFFKEIYISDGLLTSLTSLRSDIFVERVIPTVYSWEWYNFIIGGYYLKLPIAEMDLIDLFVFYGICGSIVYFVLIFGTIFKFDLNNRLAWFFVGAYILIGSLAGHFFTSGTNAAYIALLCLFLQKGDKYYNLKKV